MFKVVLLLLLLLCTFVTVSAVEYPAMNVYSSTDCTGTPLYSEIIKAPGTCVIFADSDTSDANDDGIKYTCGTGRIDFEYYASPDATCQSTATTGSVPTDSCDSIPTGYGYTGYKVKYTCPSTYTAPSATNTAVFSQYSSTTCADADLSGTIAYQLDTCIVGTNGDTSNKYTCSDTGAVTVFAYTDDECGTAATTPSTAFPTTCETVDKGTFLISCVGVPTSQPSAQPSMQPSLQPSSRPSSQPSSQPSLQPSLQPSSRPSSQPSLQPSLQPSAQPSSRPSAPTEAPTRTPTLAAVPTASPSPVQLSVVQTLNGISAASFDTSAQSVFKTAVAQVLSAYGVQSSDVTITSYSNARRMLHEIQSRILTGTLQVSYSINFVAQSAGYTSSSSAATAVTSTLTAAVQSSTFNTALNAAAQSAGNTQMQSVTSSSTISVTNTTPSGSSSSKSSIDEGAAIGGALGGFFGALLVGLVGIYIYYNKYSKYPWEVKSIKETEKSNFTTVNQNADIECIDPRSDNKM